MRLFGLGLMALGTFGCVTPNRPIKSSGSVDSATISVDDGGIGSDGTASRSDVAVAPDSSLEVAIPADGGSAAADLRSTSTDTGAAALDMSSLEVPRNPPGAPSVTVTPRSPTNNTRPTWTWMSSGGTGSGLYRYRLDVNDLTQNSVMGTQASLTPAQPLSEGTHTLYVQERNAAGDWSASGSAEIIIDVTPPKAPVFLTVPRSPLNGLMPTWKWMSGGGGNGTYRTKLDDANLEVGAAISAATEFMHGAKLSESTHTLFVQEADAAGNWSPSSSKSLALALRGSVGAVAFSAGPANGAAITFSSNSLLYSAFSDGGRGDRVTVMRLNGNSWEAVGTPGFSSGFAGDVALALNAAGVPYVAFSAEVGPGGTNFGSAHVMRWSGSGWEIVGSAGFSKGVARGLDIAFAADGSPYVSFVDEANLDRATVMRFNGSGWQTVGSPGFSAHEVGGVFLKLNSKDMPYVCFTDGSTVRSAVMRFDGSVWESVGPTELVPETTQNCSLAFSSGDVPYVAFQHSAADHRSTVLRFANGSWQPVGNVRFSPNGVQWVSLGLDKADSPYVAFTDEVSGKVGVMTFDGSSWGFVGPSGLLPGFVGAHSLAISPGGVPYVGFMDTANGDRMTVFRTSFDP